MASPTLLTNPSLREFRAHYQALASVTRLRILGEAGEASARAVELCGQRWHAAGRKVQVVMPDTGSDLNDQLMAAAP